MLDFFLHGLIYPVNRIMAKKTKPEAQEALAVEPTEQTEITCSSCYTYEQQLEALQKEHNDLKELHAKLLAHSDAQAKAVAQLHRALITVHQRTTTGWMALPSDLQEIITKAIRYTENLFPKKVGG